MAYRSLKIKGVYEMLKNMKVPESPSWKTRENDSQLPNTSEMLNYIAENRDNWITRQNSREYQKRLHQLKIEYVLNSNRGEGEGTQTRVSTEEAINERDDQPFSNEKQVSKNLFTALNHLEERNSGEEKGLLDVEECILDAHKHLMKNLLDSKRCGEFSTDRRIAAGGHEYPTFDTKEDAFEAVQKVIDTYNTTIDYVKNCQDLDPIRQTSMYIRCAAWILYSFVALHPFADGNGRMCRLLASHCLYLVFPFPCPIYNIYAPTDRDDYLRALRKADEHEGKELGDLTALIIESGWHTAQFLNDSDEVQF